MVSPAPAWRVKARPCPFYQQGRCLFEDSCNFMHNVSVRSLTVDPTPSKGTLPNLPVVTVQSPQSVRSPPRSPRMSDLLFALRDVIGDEPEESLEDTSEGATFIDNNDSPGESDAASVASVHSNDDVLPVGNSDRPSADADHRVSPSDDALSIPAENHATGGTSPDIEHVPDRPAEQADTFDLLSPVNLSHLNLTAFTRFDYEPSSKDGDSIDSGYADTWTAPQPFVLSPPPHPPSSTFDLLSSPFGAPSSRVLSPRLSAFISHPPPSPSGSPSSTVDDLSLDSPGLGLNDRVMVDDNTPGSQGLLHATGGVAGGDVEADPIEDLSTDVIDFGPTSRWDSSEEHTTAVFIGMPPLTPREVSDATIHASTTPTHFLAEAVNFVEGETNGSFTAVSRSPSPTPPGENNGEPVMGPLLSSDGFGGGINQEQNYLESSFTAELAYLTSPKVPSNENDTLNSIYDDYTTNPNEQDTSMVLGINTDITPSPETAKEPLSAKTPIRCEPIREMVFTPPIVHRGHSGTVAADSPTSLPSPGIFSDAPHASRISSHSRGACSVWSPDSPVSDVQELPESKKIPFGFRHSRLVGHARNSSLNFSPARRLSALVNNRNSSSQSDRAFSPDTPSPLAGGLRPLKLSSILGPAPSSAPSGNSHFSFNSIPQHRNINRLSMSSTTVSSESSISRNPLISSPRSSPIPKHTRNTLFTSQDIHPSSSHHSQRLSKLEESHSTLIPNSPPLHYPSSVTDDMTQTGSNDYRPSSRFSEPSFGPEDEDEENYDETNYDYAIRRPLPVVPHTAPVSRTTSVTRPPMYAIATPPPTLMFAIASDNVDQVRQVLANGDAGPNDSVGPQSALAFALTNDQLAHKIDIVKTLLAYGADPTVLKKEVVALPDRVQDDGTATPPPSNAFMDAMDPATRYYVERADAPNTRRTSALIHRSFFRPLTRVQYELIGQDRALEQLFRVLSMHSRRLSVTPIVVLLCGPSGHGKSLLARKFGSLLDVPTHTVNMTVLNSTQDLWQSYSMSPYEAPTTCTLAEFLINNEGKRCVVVLDEIEKTHDEKTLWSLLMPWELGRCTFEANGRHIDVRNVVWLGTSNVGHDLVFEHHYARAQSDDVMSREEYVELMGLLRPRVSERLGASILSRVTTVLPFVPFTSEEKRAICFEALHNLAGEVIRTLPTDVVASMVDGALASYLSAEGARSLYRAVSNQLVDNI